MAPEADMSQDVADESAAAPAETGASEVVARADRSPATLEADLSSEGPPSLATGIDSALDGHERQVLARLDAADIATDAAPALAPAGEGELTDLLSEEAPVDQAARVPTLSQPETMQSAAITEKTRALIDQAEGGAPPPARTEGGDDMLYVTGSWVNVRSGPSTSFGVITALPYGEAVEFVAEEESGWARIRLDEGREGFMARSFLSEEPTGG
ncbi:MAG: SH3 domain-containing protein [Paracoccaceae bacterium]|nr:SH3 domain-containing protein [Paracoccaceae bacterium]